MAKKKTIPKTQIEKKKTTKKVEPLELFNESPNIDTKDPLYIQSEPLIEPENQNMIVNEPLPLYKSRQKGKEFQPRSFNSENPKQEKGLPAFDKTLPVYLQIHKGNIFSIFASAIIAPVKYIRNRAFPDVQSIVENVLIISNGYIANPDSNQVLLEITLPDSDQEIVETKGQVAILKMPLPLSRVKAIHVSNDDIKRDIITKSLTGDGGIIPETLFKVNSFKSFDRVENEQTNIPLGQDYTEELRKFDKILGSFAYVKNYSILLSNRTDNISLLPRHFFYMAQALNKLPEFEVEKNEKSVQFYKKLFGIDKHVEQEELRWFFERLNDLKNFTNADVTVFRDLILLNKQAENWKTKIDEHFKNLTDSLKRKQLLGEIPELPDQIKLYINLFGSLRIYGNLNSEDKSISRRELPELVSPHFGEYIFACLGYYYGYTTLRNFEEKISIKDKYFSEVISKFGNLAIKFELTTLLDYVIIESVYQSVFGSRGSLSNISFLHSISLKKELVRRPSGALPSNYTFSYSDVLGKFNFTMRKKSADEDAIYALEKINEDIPIVSELGLFCWRAGINRSSLSMIDLSTSPDKIRYYIYFKKADVIEALKLKTINAEEFLTKLELSKNLHELK